jgi:hypothetical protein
VVLQTTIPGGKPSILGGFANHQIRRVKTNRQAAQDRAES